MYDLKKKVLAGIHSSLEDRMAGRLQEKPGIDEVSPDGAEEVDNQFGDPAPMEGDPSQAGSGMEIESDGPAELQSGSDDIDAILHDGSEDHAQADMEGQENGSLEGKVEGMGGDMASLTPDEQAELEQLYSKMGV